MILVTVGTQLPFDRLIQSVDAWASAHPSIQVMAQIGSHAWKPKHMQWVEFWTPAEFRTHVAQADLIVSHAGMGTILTSLELGKPLILLPRRFELMEQRNNHQLDTAQQLEQTGWANVASDEQELTTKLNDLAHLPPAKQIGCNASPELIASIRNFILRPQEESIRKIWAFRQTRQPNGVPQISLKSHLE